MRKKMYVMILLAAFLAAGASFKSDAAAKYAISGGSKKVQWDYNKRTKTLIFSPNKSKDHLQERLDDLEMCKQRAQKVIYKKGLNHYIQRFIRMKMEHIDHMTGWKESRLREMLKE